MKDKLIDFFRHHSSYQPEPDENLFETGVLDSFGIVEFLGYIQDEIGVEIPVEKITEDNFSTLENIIRLIEEQSAVNGR